MTNSKDNKTHVTQVRMTEANFQRHKTLVTYFYSTTLGPHLRSLATKDLNRLEEKVIADKAKGLKPPERSEEIHE